MRGVWIVSGAALVATASLGTATAQRARAGEGVAAQLQRLEDREAIRALFVEYGRTLDNRDFAGFAQLFASDGEFVGGGGASAKGREAVGALLERLITTNYPDSKGRNFHMFFNESITVAGEEATAVSKGAFVSAGGRGSRPELLQVATYRDRFVKEDGRWRFKRREIQSAAP